ncbi:MAG: hypothetical protein IPK18_04420 [Sphingobacteriales bacterium]|nr:MAG: hypothetical protein IPK18_04420 [Sphingobacteriales bacterium]
MKNFIIKILLFTLIPLIILLASNILIPIKTWVYRPWEALIFSEVPSDSPFYPNSTLNMNSVGDLCHHSKNSIVKKEYWKTDELGYRNNKHINDPDILIIGDSFVAGSGLNQSNTVCNLVSKFDKNLKVYNIAPSTVVHFDYLLNTGKINRPKLVIFSMVERDIPEKIQFYTRANFIKSSIKKIFYSINSYIDSFLKFLPLRWLKARVNCSKGKGIEGVSNSNMYFLQGSNQKHQKDDLTNTVNNLIAYKKYFDKLGIKFIFMPMPDKETVYYEFVPFKKQPDYLFRLDSMLINSNISTINTLNIYNNYRKNNNKLLYHLDDTHWNSNASEIIALEIINKARILGLIEN